MTAGLRSYRLRNAPWKPDLKYLHALGLNIDPANAATLDLLDYAANAYLSLAMGRQSGDHNLFGPQGVPLWLNYFHNDNLTYAVNNWVGAAAAADRLSFRPTLRVLEIGAGTGSATDILLTLLSERGLLPRLERYIVTEPKRVFPALQSAQISGAIPEPPAGMERRSIWILEWSTQGIASGEFDLVYPVNVMHISKNLLFSLNEARSALATDGWLVIGECVRPYDNQPMYPELMFQILDSFANVETYPEIRPNPGFMTAEQWRRAFLKSGFTYTDIVPDIERIREFIRIFSPGPFADRTRGIAK